MHGMWDLISLTRDQTRAPCIGRLLNHWTTREVLGVFHVWSVIFITSVSPLPHLLILSILNSWILEFPGHLKKRKYRLNPQVSDSVGLE